MPWCAPCHTRKCGSHSFVCSLLVNMYFHLIKLFQKSVYSNANDNVHTRMRIHDSFVVYTILEPMRTTASAHTASLIRAQVKYMCKQRRIVWMDVGRGRRRQFDNNCVGKFAAKHFNSTETSVSSVVLSVPIPMQSQWRQPGSVCESFSHVCVVCVVCIFRSRVFPVPT